MLGIVKCIAVRRLGTRALNKLDEAKGSDGARPCYPVENGRLLMVWRFKDYKR
jgi:hypothetical protein